VLGLTVDALLFRTAESSLRERWGFTAA